MPTMPAILGSALRLGNFRLGYESAALATIRRTRIRIQLAAADVRVRVSGLSIRDILNDTPNTAALTIASPAPTTGQPLRITINSDTPRLLFNGTIQTDDLSYEGKPTQLAYPCNAIDDTARANNRRPFGTWTLISATTIAQYLVTTYAPGFTSVNVQASLPAVTITFDGNEDFSSCLVRLANMIGGYFYWEDGDLHFFTAEATDTPDPLTRTPYADVVLAAAPTAYWRLGEASGLTLVDASAGAAHPITLASSVGVTYGVAGAVADGNTGLALSGVTGYRGTFTPIVTGTTFSIEFFFTPNGNAGSDTYQMIIGNGAVGPWLYFMDSTAGGGTASKLNLYYSTADHAPGAVLVNGTRYHVVLTVAAGVGQFYLNGVADGATMASVPSISLDSVFAHASAAEWLKASLVDELSVNVGVALTPTQVATRYALRTATYPFLDNPPIRVSIDDSQVKNKVYGKGHGEAVPCDVLAGENIIPLPDAVMFNATGGQALAGTTPAGAQSQILTYTGTRLGGAGSLIGPGASPSVALTAAATTGAGVESGDHSYAYTYVTAAGESVASPLASVSLPGLVPGATTFNSFTPGLGVGGLAIGSTYEYACAWSRSTTAGNHSLETSVGALVGVVARANTGGGGGGSDFNQINLPFSADPTVKFVMIYRRLSAGAYHYLGTRDNPDVTGGLPWSDGASDASVAGNPAPSNTLPSGNQVALSGIALGPTGTTQRKIYRTVAAGSQLKLQQTIANNTATVGVQDATADASLGANVPTSDTSGLAQPSGQINAGSTTLLTASPAPFSSTGGWVFLGGDQVVRYTGITGNTLTGIPATGTGAIVTTVLYGQQVLPAPSLTGVTGLTLAMQKGTPVHIWVERNDLTAQASAAASESTATYTSTGIHEFLIVDERRGEASLIARCDAELVRYSMPIATVIYATRDVKTKSGKPIVVNLVSPPISRTLTIQEVTITEMDVSPGLAPKFLAKASTVRFSLEDILRKIEA